MGEIIINAAIFPYIMGISLADNDGEKVDIELPRSANLLYLDSIKDVDEKNVLIKYARNEKFEEKDYQKLCNLFFTQYSRKQSESFGIENMLDHFGIIVNEAEDGKIKLSLKEELVPQIKATTWEAITLDLLKPVYTDIINKFEFGDININLNGWKSEADDAKQSILSSFRSAFVFTIFNYLYSEEADLYNGFESFFKNEFAKRIGLLYSIWKYQGPNQKLNYLPIYDSFYNFKDVDKNRLISTIHLLLNDDNIILDERNELKHRIINQTEKLHAIRSQDSIELEKKFIKPVINYLMEIEYAETDLKAAEVLFQQKLANSSIDRCYYAMMHGLKAYLEHIGELSEWQTDILNSQENHAQLQSKLKGLCKKGKIQWLFYGKYKFVKAKRWSADYNVSYFTLDDTKECIDKSKDFVEMIKEITLPSIK